ncbi:MAG: S-layer homology domain-containing protein [Firmicutes bacterium]|nr:S-layer homology domain-containing protein [Bacillota bacterium]
MKNFPYKKAFSLLTAAFLSVNTFSVTANDTQQAVVHSENEIRSIMEDTLSLVKERIGDTSKYDKFTSNYELLSENSSDNEDINFQFNWEKTDTDETLVICVSGSGIINYLSKNGSSSYNYSSDTKNLSDKFSSREQNRQKAQSLLDKLNPDLKGHLFVEYSDNNKDLSVFNIKRYENNIKVSGDEGSLRLSDDGSEITYLSVGYTENADFASADNLLDTASAKEAYKKAVPLKAKYFTSYNGSDRKVYLAYTPDFSKGKFIYALNGELFDYEVYSASDYAEEEAADMGLNAASAKSATGFSEAELSELSELNSHYTVDEVKQILSSNKYLGLSDYTLSGANTTTNEYKERVISCSLRKNADDTDNSETYSYAYVTLNAETADIMNFSKDAYTYDDYENAEKQKIDFDILANKAETIAKEFAGDKFDEYKLLTDLEKEKEYYNDKDNTYYTPSFRYTRYVNDIEYSDNYINISINKYTGELENYSISYLPDKSAFPVLPASALSLDKAYDMILSSYNFDMKYYAPYDKDYEKSGNRYYIPLYSLSGATSSKRYYYDQTIRIDVTDGSHLNRNGEKEKDEITGNYTDIANSPYKKEIEMLAFMNYGFTGDKFKPAEPITYKELYENFSFDNDLKDSNKTVTLGEFAKILSSSYVSDKISSSDIFIEKYQSKYNNYILIAQALGLIPQSEDLDPDSLITREDAAHTKYIIYTDK